MNAMRSWLSFNRKCAKRERRIGAIGRPFKLNVKNRFLILLVYYRLYIAYTLTSFLFDLDQSNICRDIQKIGPLIRKCVPIPQKLYNMTKQLKTSEEVEKYFSGFLSFTDCTEKQIPKPAIDKDRKKNILFFRQKEKTCYQKSAYDG